MAKKSCLCPDKKTYSVKCCEDKKTQDIGKTRSDGTEVYSEITLEDGSRVIIRN